ncbi:hypothetical protein [Eel River basin pequenovirus]|nr:hypothetical protein [Eel River basin pequenovirus]
MVHGKQQGRSKKHAPQRRNKPDSVRDPFKEYPDPTPVVIPVGFGPKPRAQRDELMHMLNEQRLREEEENYVESPEEADDFFVEDEGDVLFSAYELSELQEEAPIDLEVDDESDQAESNETDNRARETKTAHDQSAPVEDSPGEDDSEDP